MTEPESWWTPEEREHCRKTIVYSDWKKDWLGRQFRFVRSNGKDNIYKEDFIWKEYKNG